MDQTNAGSNIPTGIRVVVVEDEIIVARDIEMKLKKLGYNVLDIAASGEEAIQKAGDLLPDLMLMDITLEGDMDGIEAAGQIDALYNIPIVYLTAHTDLDTLSRARTTEPYGYIIKPFAIRDLLVTISMALYKHRMEARNKVINTILKVFLKPITLKEKLEQSLGLITSIPRLFLQTKGAIFLVEDDPAVLVLKASLGTPDCEKITPGKCLCGMAMSTKEIVFAEKIDKRHELNQDALPHGHYCVPILAANKLLGVICAYVREGHKRDVADEEVLTSFADIIANVLSYSSQ
ncbi:response regulator [Candidatus Magnetomonas plexicatena]|uniref:response regulator n=1 Tax=Candidatus Magnetomonas plexicatena TaxID=2552947 RepID=UPI001C75A322|nr:response regulator [Nitrospirales bacterium LBB_01]